MNIYFRRVGYTSTGRPWYRLCHPGGPAFGRRFCIRSERERARNRSRRCDAKPAKVQRRDR